MYRDANPVESQELASSFAMAAPIPLDAPVTTATLPSSFFECVLVCSIFCFLLIACVHRPFGRLMPSVAESRSSPAAAEQVKVSPHCRQRVA
jgi:hypothetical protein